MRSLPRLQQQHWDRPRLQVGWDFLFCRDCDKMWCSKAGRRSRNGGTSPSREPSAGSMMENILWLVLYTFDINFQIWYQYLKGRRLVWIHQHCADRRICLSAFDCHGNASAGEDTEEHGDDDKEMIMIMLQWELYSMIQMNTELERTVRRGALTNENELDYAALITLIDFLRVVPSPLSTWTNWGAGTSAPSQWSEGASGKTESLKIYINIHHTHPCDTLWCTGLIHYISRLLVCSSEGFLHLYSLDQVPKACFSELTFFLWSSEKLLFLI